MKKELCKAEHQEETTCTKGLKYIFEGD